MRLSFSVLCAPALLCVCNADGSSSPSGALVPLWTSAAANGGTAWVGGTPAVDAGRLFVQESNNLVALDATTGARLWARRIRIAASPPPTTLIAAGGRVFVSETDSIMSVDAATGATVWNVHPDSQAVTAPALDDATYYTGQRGVPFVYALAKDNGALRWKVNVGTGYAFPAHVRGVAVSNDTLYVTVERYLNPNGASATAVLVALDRRDGRELWRFESSGTKNWFLGAPVPLGNIVLATDFGSGDLVAINKTSHQEAWRTGAGGAEGAYVSGQVAFVAGFDQTARAIDLATGRVVWNTDTGSSAIGYGTCGPSFFVSAFKLRRFDGASGSITGESNAGGAGGFVTYVASDGASAYVTSSAGVFAFSCS